MATDARGHDVPTGSDFAQRQTLINLSLSINDIPACSSESAMSLIVANLAANGVNPTASKPLYVFRTDLSAILATMDGSTWTQLTTMTQCGSVSGPSNVGADSTATYAITFPRPFATVPTVMISTDNARMACEAKSITQTGFSLGARNVSAASTSSSVVYSWVAFG